MKISMETLSKLIKLKHNDVINDNPHELLFLNNFEIVSSVSAIMIKPIIKYLGSEE